MPRWRTLLWIPAYAFAYGVAALALWVWTREGLVALGHVLETLGSGCFWLARLLGGG